MLDELFDAVGPALRAAGADHPDLAFPGPLAGRLVHWLDRVAPGPGADASPPAPCPARSPPGPVTSRRAPTRRRPRLRPTSRTGTGDRGQAHLFTASRLDGPKRLDLLIEAMAHVPRRLPLLIGGTGPATRS